MTTRKWLTLLEAAHELGISDKTVRRWCRDKKILHKREAGKLLIPVEAIEQHNQQAMVKPTKPKAK